MEKRTKKIEIRVTKSEHEKLLQLKTKPRLAEWIREFCLSGKQPPAVKKIDPELLYQLNRIGVNLNQIALVCNQKKKDIDTLKVLQELIQIEALIQELFATHVK